MQHLYKANVAAQLEFVDSKSALASRTLKLLDQNLVAKVNASIKERAACALALLNNGNYVHEGVVQHSNLRRSLGEAWEAQHSAALQQTRSEYWAASWEPLLSVIQAGYRENSSTVRCPLCCSLYCPLHCCP